MPPTSSTSGLSPLNRKDNMSQPDGFSPLYPGSVAGQGFQSTLTGDARDIPQKLIRSTNGTTEVNVFGTTNPADGTFLGARVISKNNTAANITLQHTVAGTTVFTIAKGSEGALKGTFFPAVAFAAGATATIKSSVAGADAVVEIDFILTNPKLPGAL